MHGTAPLPHKEIEVKLELAPASLPALKRLSLLQKARTRPSRAFAAGLLTGREDARAEAAMKVATQAYAEFAKIKPFWR